MSKKIYNQLKKRRDDWLRVLKNARNPEDEKEIKEFIDILEEQMAFELSSNE